MLCLMVMLMRLGATCGAEEVEVRAAVRADAAERFRSEAEAHGTVAAEQGCEVTMSGEMLSAAQRKQDATGAPIDGWLLESPRDTSVYRCTYEGQFSDGAGRVAVWEAAGREAGGPRPALDLEGR